MAEYKVACPQCHSHLRSARPIPAGMKVKCPKCGILFSVPQEHHAAAMTTPGVDGVHALATLPSAATPAIMAAPPVVARATLPTTPGQVQTAAPTAKRAMLAAILGGAGLLLVVAVVLVFYCFSGDERKPPTTNTDDLPENTQLEIKQKRPAPQPLVVLTPEEQKKVDAAVARGVGYLKKRQLPDGRWPNIGGHGVGPTALAALTLLEAKVPANDPVITKAAAQVRGGCPQLRMTYDLSLAILFLNRLGDRQDRELIQQLTLRLVAGQTALGGWSYTCPLLSKEEHEMLFGALKELQRRTPEELQRDSLSQASRLREWLKQRQRRTELQSQGRPLPFLQPDQFQPDNFYRNPAGGDNSNTQFAILALWAARSHEVPLDRTLSLIHKRFRATQNPDGRWTYDGHREVVSQPTMTCAGLLGIAVGFGLQDAGKGGVRPDQDPTVQKGLSYLSRFLGDPSTQPHAAKARMQPLYFLWSVERVAVLYQLKTINSKKWYHWGVEVLTDNQRPDGSWFGGGTGSSVDFIDTCFGLLFLQRVNLAKDLTDKLMELSGSGFDAAPPPGRKE